MSTIIVTDPKALIADIVDRHAEAMLTELQAEGIDPVGIAGGIMLAAQDKKSLSPCHVFMLIQPGLKTANGDTVPAAEFVADMAHAMLRSFNANHLTQHRHQRMRARDKKV
jgi:hypothetical protein